MAGSFLGWQPVVVAFFVSVLPALGFGIVQVIVFKDNSLPFGPSLAAGVVITWLCWPWIGPAVQPLFFWPEMLFGLAAVDSVLMLGMSYMMRFMRRAE